MSMPEIAVVVHDGDPLSRAGVIEFLEQQSGMVVLGRPGESGADHARSVAVVLVDVLDASTVVRVRRLVAEMDKKSLLVVGELNEPQIELVLDAGVRFNISPKLATPATRKPAGSSHRRSRAWRRRPRRCSSSSAATPTTSSRSPTWWSASTASQGV